MHRTTGEANLKLQPTAPVHGSGSSRFTLRSWALQTVALCLGLGGPGWGNLGGNPAFADPPVTMYIFPAGGQRGTDVFVRVGGLYLHDSAPLDMLGPGVSPSDRLEEVDTVWFEGPVIPLPDSQQSEDYPRDHRGTVRIAADAPLGARPWRTWTSQGAAPSRTFLVGDLPEIVEQEIDGRPVPVPVDLPVTINGRIFPREDVDVWTFAAHAGETFTLTAVGASLGSPLDIRLEVRDPSGRPIAESAAVPLPGCDASLRFTAPLAGRYSARIHDLKFGGLQHYVYRLTLTAGPHVDRIFPLGARRGSTAAFQLLGQAVPDSPVDALVPADGSRAMLQFPTPNGLTNPVGVELDDLPELVEGRGTPANETAAPFVANGRILQGGEVDAWPVLLRQGETVELEVQAARLGSPLDSVLSVQDATGKELAQNDDLAGNCSDSRLTFTAPADGVYQVRVAERDVERGGEAFAYRLRVAAAAKPDFRLTLPTDVVTAPRGGEAKLKVKIEAVGGFADEVELSIEGLPAGVGILPAPLRSKPGEFELTFKPEAGARVTASRLQIRGAAVIGGVRTERTATQVLEAAGRPEIAAVLLAVTIPTPFKVKGIYEVKYAQRGSRFVRRFALDRGGYEGPLTVRLADRQTRHLQGVTGPTVEIPAGATEFEYPVFLPPWMEIGRTSRSVVMAVGEVRDTDGATHKVSFTSLAQNEQIVALVDPGQLSLELSRKTGLVRPGSELVIGFRVGRGTGVAGEARVELIIPRHLRGVSAEPVTISAYADAGELRIRFADTELGPFNQPLTVRATVLKDGDLPFVAEAKWEAVEAVRSNPPGN